MPRLAGSEVVIPKQMSEAERRALADALFAVHCEIFDGVERDAFVKYVIDSKAERTKIQIHKGEDGKIVGYFALHFFEKRLRGEPVTIVRGETGTLRAYRGQSSTMSWGVRQLVDYVVENPGRTMYGLGCVVHPSSYLIAARYFDVAWPKPDEEVPPDILAFMLELADEFHLEPVDPLRPLVRHVGWKTRDTEVERAYWRQCDKPGAQFYVTTNPGYGEGHGLLTMAPLTPGAIAGAAARFARGKLDLAIQGALGAAQRLPLAGRLLRPGDVRRRLRAAPLFAGLDEASLRAIAEQAEIVAHPAGSVLFREGDAGDDMYVIARGAVYVVGGRSGEEDVIDQLGTGSIFGEVATLTGGRRSASIRTAIPSTLIRIPGGAVRALMQRDAAVRDAVWGAFAARIFDDHLRASGRYPELGRMARQAWIRRGRHEDVPAAAAVSGEGDALLLVLSGSALIERGGAQISAQAPMVVEVDGPLQVLARSAARVVHVPPLGGSFTASRPAPRDPRAGA